MSLERVNKEDIDRVNIRSDEVNEIMECVPSRLIRFGITLISIVVLLAFSGTFYFKYPDTIKGNFVITSSNPPTTLRSKVNGNVARLFFRDRDYVQKGDLIALISNTANFEDMVRIKGIISKGEVLPYIDSLNLGEVQSAYIEYVKALFDYQEFFKTDYYGSQARVIQHELEKRKEQLKYYMKAEEYSSDHYNIEKELLTKDSAILEIGGISLKDYQLSKAKLLELEATCNNSQMSRSEAELTISKLSKEFIETERQREQEERKLKDQLNASLGALKNAIIAWEDNYCLVSTINGVVSLKDVWQLHQNVQIGQNIVSIVPQEKNRLVIRISIPVNGAGKVKEGNYVNLSFSDYPEEEFGIVRCCLGQMSLLPDSNYTSVINMCDTLKTNYGKILSFKQNMGGDAIIITEDLSLFQRLINPIRLALTKYNTDN